MAKLSWTPTAEHCLRDIHDTIATEQPRAAIRVVKGLLPKH